MLQGGRRGEVGWCGGEAKNQGCCPEGTIAGVVLKLSVLSTALECWPAGPMFFVFSFI